MAFNDDTRRGNDGDVTYYLLQDIEFESHYFYKWFDVIKKDERWINAQYEAYKKLYVDMNLDSLMISYVDSLVDYLRSSIEENYKIWSISKQTHLVYKLYSTYDEYLSDLKTFIKLRNAYIYSQFARKIGKDVTNNINYYTKHSTIDYMLSYNKGDQYICFLNESPTFLDLNAVIYNSQGNEVGRFNSKDGYNAYNLPKGIYLIRWVVGDYVKAVKLYKD